MSVTISSKKVYTSFFEYITNHIQYPYSVDRYGIIYEEAIERKLFLGFAFSHKVSHEVAYISDNKVTINGHLPELEKIITNIAEEYSIKTGTDIEIVAKYRINL